MPVSALCTAAQLGQHMAGMHNPLLRIACAPCCLSSSPGVFLSLLSCLFCQIQDALGLCLWPGVVPRAGCCQHSMTHCAVLHCAALCRYKSVLVSKKWMLKGVTGECNSDELPSHPSPSFPPEAVVEAQLAALR